MEATAEETRTTLRRTSSWEFFVNEVNVVKPSRSAKKTRGGRYERTAKGAGPTGKRGTWWEEREIILERAEETLSICSFTGSRKCCCGCQHMPDSRTAGSIPTWQSGNILASAGLNLDRAFFLMFERGICKEMSGLGRLLYQEQLGKEHQVAVGPNAAVDRHSHDQTMGIAYTLLETVRSVENASAAGAHMACYITSEIFSDPIESTRVQGSAKVVVVVTGSGVLMGGWKELMPEGNFRLPLGTDPIPLHSYRFPGSQSPPPHSQSRAHHPRCSDQWCKYTEVHHFGGKTEISAYARAPAIPLVGLQAGFYAPNLVGTGAGLLIPRALRRRRKYDRGLIIVTVTFPASNTTSDRDDETHIVAGKRSGWCSDTTSSRHLGVDVGGVRAMEAERSTREWGLMDSRVALKNRTDENRRIGVSAALRWLVSILYTHAMTQVPTLTEYSGGVDSAAARWSQSSEINASKSTSFMPAKNTTHNTQGIKHQPSCLMLIIFHYGSSSPGSNAESERSCVGSRGNCDDPDSSHRRSWASSRDFPIYLIPVMT
ncbi:hypothetical protein DFH07DRAFT_773635 [Mycena maculata]|uniref:Uncharacterized protein n=1 Tax=Mycena maculata TaxID=230809 RepID=A0AAD7J0T5_9AGAR|nr:hypothetical protein DFH07DRAFT_773635 [Mycena maculata]